jgi:hypothetical protein
MHPPRGVATRAIVPVLIGVVAISAACAWLISRGVASAPTGPRVASPDGTEVALSADEERSLERYQGSDRDFFRSVLMRRKNLTADETALEPFFRELETAPESVNRNRCGPALGILAATWGRLDGPATARSRAINDAVRAARLDDEAVQATALTLLRLIDSDGKGLPPEARSTIDTLLAKGFIQQVSDQQMEIYRGP